jgi:hypothetical protein
MNRTVYAKVILSLSVFVCIALAPQGAPSPTRACTNRESCNALTIDCNDWPANFCERCSASFGHQRCDGPTLPLDVTCTPNIVVAGCGTYQYADCDQNRKCVNWVPSPFDCDREICSQ